MGALNYWSQNLLILIVQMTYCFINDPYWGLRNQTLGPLVQTQGPNRGTQTQTPNLEPPGSNTWVAGGCSVGSCWLGTGEHLIPSYIAAGNYNVTCLIIKW